MPTIHPGQILLSTPLLNNTVFEQTTIFICEANSNGAMGFIINKPSYKSLNELVEFRNLPYFALHNGGPMQTDKLYFIHKQPSIIHGGIPIINQIYLGGNFDLAIKNINNKTILKSDIKICIGYCGWDTGELEAEIEEGCWSILENDNSVNVFM
ncbi:MAG: YqgE/AlgH family protein [Ferruginibacter sp.]|nr:YqgE/AlgH family protein [Ferruginibacter sp.]